LLAIALQTAAEEGSFAALTGQEILGPLGMVKTQPYNSQLGTQLPRGFDASGDATATGWGPFPAYFGAGGLVSTPNEMMTWLQFSMGIIQSGSLNEILSVPPATAAGVSTWLGWFESVIQNSSGSKLTILQKNGDLAGFSSQIAILPPQSDCANSGAGVFALVNGGNATSTQNSAATSIAYALMLSIAGL
jgi:serine-type D-Ala-D-Ala carboxypeptidase/endopeptidase